MKFKCGDKVRYKGTYDSYYFLFYRKNGECACRYLGDGSLASIPKDNLEKIPRESNDLPVKEIIKTAQDVRKMSGE